METLNKIIEMNGNFELFDNSLLKIRGSLEGNLSPKGHLLLKGCVKNYGSFPMPDAEVSVTDKNVVILTKYLGQNLVLHLKKNSHLHLESEPVEFKFSTNIEHVEMIQLDSVDDIEYLKSSSKKNNIENVKQDFFSQDNIGYVKYTTLIGMNVIAEVLINLSKESPELIINVSGSLLDNTSPFSFTLNTNENFNSIDEFIDYITDQIDFKQILKEYIKAKVLEYLEKEWEEWKETMSDIEMWLEMYRENCWDFGPVGEYIPAPGCPIPFPLVELAVRKRKSIKNFAIKVKDKIETIKKKF